MSAGTGRLWIRRGDIGEYRNGWPQSQSSCVQLGAGGAVSVALVTRTTAPQAGRGAIFERVGRFKWDFKIFRCLAAIRKRQKGALLRTHWN